MSAPKITEQEKKALRNNAKTELERLEACLADQRTVQLAELKTTSNKLEIITELNSLFDERNKKCKILK